MGCAHLLLFFIFELGITVYVVHFDSADDNLMTDVLSLFDSTFSIQNGFNTFCFVGGVPGVNRVQNRVPCVLFCELHSP